MDRRSGEANRDRGTGDRATVSLIRTAAAVLGGGRYVVRGRSMSPAFEPGHHLLMRRVAGGGGRLGRGDVVIVRDPRDVAKLYLKRMVGLPGEEVRFAGGLLLVDGVHLTEPYLGGLPSAPGLSDGVWTLGSGEYFVMGDNRLRSTDSRDFGPVGVSLVEGKAWFRYWPIRRWGRVSH